MNVLWCTFDRSLRIESYYEEWISNVESIAKVDVLRINTQGVNAGKYRNWIVEGKIVPENRLNNIDFEKYDFVICEDFISYSSDNWNKIKIPKALYIEDLHGNGPIQIKLALKAGCRVIIHKYLRHFKEVIKKMAGTKNTKFIWSPHSVDTNFFKPYGKKTREVVVLGVANDVYPMRKQIHRELRNQLFYERIERPHETATKQKKWPVGIDYVKVIASAKICPTGGSIFHYPVAKYFEIPACGTLLMSDWFPELGLLGFVPGENMVVLEPGNLVNQMKWWLCHKDELQRVTKNGMKLVQENHNSLLRAQQLIGELKKLI